MVGDIRPKVGTVGTWQESIHILERALILRSEPSLLSLSMFRGFWKSCMKRGRWEWAIEMLGQFVALDVVPDLVSFSASISACATALAWSMALHLLFDMFSVKTCPDTIAYNAVLSACHKAGQWQLALRLLTDMGS